MRRPGLRRAICQRRSLPLGLRAGLWIHRARHLSVRDPTRPNYDRGHDQLRRQRVHGRRLRDDLRREHPQFQHRARHRSRDARQPSMEHVGPTPDHRRVDALGWQYDARRAPDLRPDRHAALTRCDGDVHGHQRRPQRRLPRPGIVGNPRRQRGRVGAARRAGDSGLPAPRAALAVSARAVTADTCGSDSCRGWWSG
jgi:hypothetical protein